MNYLPAFIAPELVQALGWTILHSLWQGALVAITLSLLMILLHRHSAKVRYGVATAALAAVLIMAGVTFVRTYRQAQQPILVTSPPATLVATAATKNNLPTTVAAPETTVRRGIILVNFKSYFSKHLPLVVLVWLLGTLMMLLKFLGGLAYIQRLKHYKIYPLGPQWAAQLQAMAQRLEVSKPVRLAESALVKTPLVIGYLKPLILLPLGTIAALSPEQVEAILAHELAHIYRKDYLFNILHALVEILFFFNPAVWWISDYVRIERENCCDDQAIAWCGNPLTYARALTSLENIPLPTPRLALAFAGKDGSLLGRIKRLVQQPNLTPTFSEGFLAACVMMVGLTVISASASADFRLPEKMPVAQNKYTPSAGVKSQITPSPETDLELKAGSYTVIDSTGKTSDLIIIKNKKGAITELYVDGRKIPRPDIPQFQSLIDQSLANIAQAPLLKPAEKTAALAEIKQSLKELEKNQLFNFPYDSNSAKLTEAHQQLLKKFGDQQEIQRQLLKQFADKPEVRQQELLKKFGDQHEVQQLLKKLGNQQFNFTLDSSLFHPSLLPAPPTFPALPALPARPPLPPLPPNVKTPLDYLRSAEVTEKTMLVIDGKKTRKVQGQNALAGLTNNNIRGIIILKGKNATQKYGNEGKDGVVEIITGPGESYFFDFDTDEQEALRKHEEALRRFGEEARKHHEKDRENELNLRTQELKTRLKELEKQTKTNLQAQLKEHEVRVKEQAIRLKEELIKDKLIQANSKISITINQDGFILNGVKQPTAVFDKYKKLFFPERKDWSGSFNQTITITED